MTQNEQDLIREHENIEKSISFLLDTPHCHEVIADLRERQKNIGKTLGQLRRRSGRSTRRVDNYIQEIFTNGTGLLLVKDHYDSSDSHARIAETVIQRLCREHGFVPNLSTIDADPTMLLKLKHVAEGFVIYAKALDNEPNRRLNF